MTSIDARLVEPAALGTNGALRHYLAELYGFVRDLAQDRIDYAAPFPGPLRATGSIARASESEPGLRLPTLLSDANEVRVDTQIIGCERYPTIPLHYADQTRPLHAT